VCCAVRRGAMATPTFCSHLFAASVRPVFATLFPLGVLQLYHSVSFGYFDARTLQFITGGANPVLEWLRLPGDVLFIVGGVLPLLYLSWLSIRYMVPKVATEESKDVRFTEIVERTGPN
jgi:nitric oxide reductase subunit B